MQGQALWSVGSGYIGDVIRWDLGSGDYRALEGGPDSESVAAMAVDGAGQLWASDGSATLWMHDGSNWATFSGPANLQALAIDAAGNKWLGGAGSVYQFSPAEEWSSYSVPGTVSAIVVDANNRKWTATDQGISKLQGSTWTHYSNSQIGVDQVANIALKNDQRLWLSDGVDQVRRYAGGDWEVVSFPNEQVYPHISAMVGDSQGNVWLATPPLELYADYEDQRDLIAVRYAGGGWDTFDPLDGLPFLDSVCATADAAGKVYFGSIGYEHVLENDIGGAGIAMYAPGSGWKRLKTSGSTYYQTGTSELVMEYPTSCAANIDEYESATVSQEIISQTDSIVHVRVAATLHLTSTTAFPIDPALIPPDIADQYLGAEGSEIPADHPAVVAMAQDVTQHTTMESSAVESIIAWVYENIHYDYGWWNSSNPKVSPDPWNGLVAFQWRYCVCEGFAEIATAMLRASLRGT